MDRNLVHVLEGSVCFASLSARRAWIEIRISRLPRSGTAVALRKESVDRNKPGFTFCLAAGKSLSARRAWIEIMGCIL